MSQFKVMVKVVGAEEYQPLQKIVYGKQYAVVLSEEAPEFYERASVAYKVAQQLPRVVPEVSEAYVASA